MVLARWQATIVNEAGDIQDGASVEVREETGGAPLASIFSDRDGVTPLGNPMTADSEGFAAFHAPGGAYRITATKGGFSRVWRYEGIGTASENDDPLLSVNNLDDVDDAADAFANIKQDATRTATGVVEEATEAEVRAATNAKFLDAGHLNTANAYVTLTDAATITVDWTGFINGRVTITTDRVLGNPTFEIPGQSRTIEVMSDGGPDELTFGSEYEVFPTLDDIATDKSYLVHIHCLAAGRFRAYADEGGDPT